MKNSKLLKGYFGSEFHHLMAFCCFESANLHWIIIAKYLTNHYASGLPHDAASICLVLVYDSMWETILVIQCHRGVVKD